MTAQDRIYDSYDLSETSLRFYSLIGAEEMTIQGKILPFDQEDRVTLGVTVSQQSSYKIVVSSLDVLFTDITQNIYLEDTYLNIIHDLRTVPYSFTSESGKFDNRFILRYTNQTLSTPEEITNF